MDEETLAIKPFKAPEGEKFGVKDPARGQRRCIGIASKQAAPGQPWSWRGCYWDHQPQTEVELLRRGFHIACIYAENPVLRSFMSKTPPLDNLAPLAKAGVPLLHVCGSLDPALDAHTRAVEKRYQELGGAITVIIKEGEGHYPLAPKDPKPVVDFIVGKAR